MLIIIGEYFEQNFPGFYTFFKVAGNKSWVDVHHWTSTVHDAFLYHKPHKSKLNLFQESWPFICIDLMHGTSHLHNNDAMLGVKICCAARTCYAGRVLALSRCAGPGWPSCMACRGWPAGCMLGDGAHDSASFDPQHAGAPFCDVICIRSITPRNSNSNS